MYKAVLENDLLQDPDEGVNYFTNTLKKCFLKGATNVYLYRLLSFFNHRRQNLKIRNPSHEIEGSMDGLDARLHGTVPIISTVRTGRKRKNNRPTSASSWYPSMPPVLLNEDNPTVLRQYITGMQDRQRDAFPFGDNLIAQFFIIQSELSDQQRKRLTSAMSLRNISLEHYSYQMLKTHYHELFITTRTSIQDPSIRPQGGNRSNTFFILEQGEHEGEEGFWVEDEDGLEGFMSNNDEETFWVLEENDAFIARKVSGISDSKREKEKENQETKRAVTNEVASNPFEKAVLAGRPILPMRTMIEARVIHPMRMAKERAEHPATQPVAELQEPAYAGWTDQDWDQSWTWHEQGWYSSHETSSTGQALMASHPREADPLRFSFRTQFVRNNTSQPFGNKVDGACHQPSAHSDLCDPGQRMYQIHGQLACNPAFYSGHRTHEGPHLLSVHPGRDQVHFCKRRNSQGKLDLESPISHNSSTQYQHRRP